LYKSIPPDELGMSVRNYPGTLVNIQRAPEAGEADRLEESAGKGIADFTAHNDDLEDMLALMTLLDHVAGVSNTNMHLLLASGGTARVLVPFPPEWRWMTGEESPWFPGFRVYRQKPGGDWNEAFEQLRADLMASFVT